MRKSGMKKIEIWVADPSSPEFLRQAKKESRAARRDALDGEAIDWLESIADTGGWKA